MRPFLIAVLVLSLVSAGCGDDSDSDTTGAEDTPEGQFPDVIDATATRDDDGSWTVSATISSPYDSPERYADAWRVIGPHGEELAIRELTHDHAGEQPFTRSHSGVQIAPSITEVTIEGRDQVSGWGGATYVLSLDEAADN